jgi:hypothetical protein
LSAIAQILEHFTKLPKHTYTRPRAADVTSLLYSICNFDFVITIVIIPFREPQLTGVGGYTYLKL